MAYFFNMIWTCTTQVRQVRPWFLTKSGEDRLCDAGKLWLVFNELQHTIFNPIRQHMCNAWKLDYIEGSQP